MEIIIYSTISFVLGWTFRWIRDKKIVNEMKIIIGVFESELKKLESKLNIKSQTK